MLVLVHEAGHFFLAKRFGIRVDEFGFGFPPKLFGKKWGETEYTLNLLPLGGFVKIFGETPDDENINGPDSARSFVNKAKWKQAVVLVAGIAMNFLLAWVLFSFGFMSGLPTSASQAARAGYRVEDVNLVIISVADNSPAQAAGLEAGDKILKIGAGEEQEENFGPAELQSFILKHSSGEIALTYERGEENGTVNILPVVENGKPMIGIAMDEIGVAQVGIFRSFWEGLKLTIIVGKGTVVGLYGLWRDAWVGQGSLESVTGPVGLVGFVGDAYRFGFAYLLSFAALISVNLAIINLFPFPALDGGRLLFLLIEKIKGSYIKPVVANAANSIGFAILILLMLLVTYNDITKLL